MKSVPLIGWNNHQNYTWVNQISRSIHFLDVIMASFFQSVEFLEMEKQAVGLPTSSIERSTSDIADLFDANSMDFAGTGNDVDLMVNIQGSAPVYLTVQSALPAYMGLL